MPPYRNSDHFLSGKPGGLISFGTINRSTNINILTLNFHALCVIIFCDKEVRVNHYFRDRSVINLIVVIIFFIALFSQGAISRAELLPSPATSIIPRAFLPFITRSAPFVKTEISPFYLQNFANNAGCNWLGMAGEVRDIDSNHLPAGSYVVHVWGSGIDSRISIGTAPAYSPSGWELYLYDSPVVRDYEIQLELPNGTAVSPIYSVQTRASCNQNLVRFDFIENG